MIFAPDLALAILAGNKTVTRRPISDNPRSPWHPDNAPGLVGKLRSVQPGRGLEGFPSPIRIVDVRRMPLARLSHVGAEREGFQSPEAFEQRWEQIHGSYDPAQILWRVEFELVEGPQPPSLSRLNVERNLNVTNPGARVGPTPQEAIPND